MGSYPLSSLAPTQVKVELVLDKNDVNSTGTSTLLGPIRESQRSTINISFFSIKRPFWKNSSSENALFSCSQIVQLILNLFFSLFQLNMSRCWRVLLFHSNQQRTIDQILTRVDTISKISTIMFGCLYLLCDFMGS